jgi:hypothetical protein
MKTITLLFVLFLLAGNSSAQEATLNEHIKKLTDELEQTYPTRRPVEVAVLDFRTSDNRITAFNTYLQNAFHENYKGSRTFRLFDQDNVNRILSSSEWDLEKSNNFTTYATLREDIFKTLGLGADAFIYGQINDNNETITITAYLIPQGVKPSRLHAAVTFPSSEETDRLLGKPVLRRRRPKPQRDTVVVVRDRIVEREVRVVDTVVVEREIEVEKPVVVRERPERPSENVVEVPGYRFELNSIERLHDGSILCKLTVTRLTRDIELNIFRSGYRGTTKIFDEAGAEYVPESINIANKAIRGSYDNHRFIQNVPTQVTFRVKSVDPDASMISLFEIVLGDSDVEKFNIQFRNIPIQ